jgi:hypothetical protein
MNGTFDLSQQGTSEQIAELESESDSGSSEESDEEHQKGVAVKGESEFENTELEDLVLKEGPQQILQLMLQDTADDLLRRLRFVEETTDAEDYADWIQWATKEEQRMQSLSEAAIATEESVLL